MERERADAVGALLVVEEEEGPGKERVEKLKKVHPKKNKKKAEEMERKASKKMRLNNQLLRAAIP